MDHRKEAARCRALAGGCFHPPAGEVLRQIAAEHEAYADRLEADRATVSMQAPQRRQTIIF
jgi:hypothetical protein